MKLKFISILFLIMSIPAFSQDRSNSPEMAQLAITDLEALLGERDSACSPNQKRLENTDLMQSYLKLTMLKQLSSPQDECDKAQAYLKCLRNLRLDFLTKHLKTNKAAGEILKSKYNISSTDLDAMLDFYVLLGNREPIR